MEGVALKKCVSAIYNNTSFRLAPHIVYTRHEEIYIDAVALEKDGQPPREMKLSTFKLAGLKDVRVEEEGFQKSELFEPAAEKYVGETLLVIDN